MPDPATPFGDHDQLLDGHRWVVEHIGSMPLLVDRALAGVLGVAAPGELVEQQPLALLHLDDPLVDAVLRQQAVHLHGALLFHPVRAGDRLVLDAGLPLRLGEDHDRRGLHVDPDSPGLDVREQHGVPRPPGDLVDDPLSRGQRDRTGDRAVLLGLLVPMARKGAVLLFAEL